MKKLFLLAASVVSAIVLCACGGGMFGPEPTPTPLLDPTEILSLEDVILAVGYQPVLDGGEIKRDGNKASALYVSNPIGEGDPVEITIVQHTQDMPPEHVWYAYDTDKSLRPSAEEVTELGENAYIAFPSINIYDRGCYVKITAGSGSDDNQRNQLLTLARMVIAKLEERVEPPVIKDNNVEQK